MPRIIVDETYCKGCGLCMDVCPSQVIALDVDRINAKGYHPAYMQNPDDCTACMSCALMCPDTAITVER